MRYVLLITSALALWLPSAAAGAEITGNRLFSDRELTKLVDLSRPDDSLIAEITSLYHRNGYFRATVENIGFNKRGERFIVIDEGRPSTIDSISIETIPESAGVFLPDLPVEYRGEAATGEILDDFAGIVIRRLAENGMPFARGEWTGFDFNAENNVIAMFRAIAGPQCYISDIAFEGLSRTRPEAIRRIIDLEAGRLYSESEVVRSERSLQRMKYIEIKSPFRLQTTGHADSCRIIYDLRELPSARFDGAGGLVKTSRKTDILGRLSLEFGDIMGTGRSFGFNWNKKDRFSNELAIDYLEPFFLGSRLDMSLGVFQLDRDSLYVETGARIGFDYRFTRDIGAGVGFSIKRTEPEEGSSMAASLGRSVKAGFNYDGADYSRNPRGGYQLRSEIDYRYRSNRRVVEGDNPPTKLTAAGLDGGFFTRLTSDLVVALQLKSWGVVSADGRVPANELTFVGGFDDLRGYAEDRFPAYRYAVMTFEPRIVSGRDRRIYLFGDLGVIKSTQFRTDGYRFFPGYGVGIVSPTAVGLFKVEMAWGKEGFPSEAVLNLGLAGMF